MSSAQALSRGPASSSSQVSSVAPLDRMACCLKIGRTLAAKTLLRDTRLFHLDDAGSLPAEAGNFVHRRGLQALWRGENIFVLDTLVGYRVLTADVAAIVPSSRSGEGELFHLGSHHVMTMFRIGLCGPQVHC